MQILTEKSFSPSNVLIRLLYLHLSQQLPLDVQTQMQVFTREQIRYGFAYTIYSIRMRNIYGDIQAPDEEFWIVGRDCQMRPEVLEEIQKRVDVHHSAEFESHDFKLRFGEEVSSWFIRNEEEAGRFALKRDKLHRIVVRREPPLDEDALDPTGCA